MSPMSPALAGKFFTPSAAWEAPDGVAVPSSRDRTHVSYVSSIGRQALYP